MILIKEPLKEPEDGFYMSLIKYRTGHRMRIYKSDREYIFNKKDIIVVDSFRNSIDANPGQSLLVYRRCFRLSEEEIINHVLLETI